MRNHILLYFIALLLTACTQNKEQIRKQVTDIEETYAKSKFKSSERSTTKDGVIIYSAGDIKCTIDPSYIITGEIDENSSTDAVASIFTTHGQGLPVKEHLILINKNGKMSVAKELSGEMKFLSISDRTIYIETSKMAPDSPFADCHLCKVIKKYKFIEGDTVEAK